MTTLAPHNGAQLPSFEDLFARLNTLSRGRGRETLTEFVETLEAAEPEGTSSLTLSDIEALKAAGSYVETMPPLSQQASYAALLRRTEILGSSYTTKELATKLGISDSRVRQLVGARKLYAVRDSGSRKHLIPSFQVLETREAKSTRAQLLPNWAAVAPHIPSDASLLQVTGFFTRPHEDLVISGRRLSPVEWLVELRDTASITTLLDTVFSAA
jgi:excisionase family DNA binding protein